MEQQLFFIMNEKPNLSKQETKIIFLLIAGVVPQNFPSHFTQYILLEILNLLRVAQGWTRQTLS